MLSTVAVYVHSISPYAIKFSDGAMFPGIRWYGIAYVFAIVIGYCLAKRIARAGVSTLDPHRIGKFVVAVAIGGIVGARLGYVLFYRPTLLWDFSSQLPWWAPLAMHQGGMSSHGGSIGALLATWWYARMGPNERGECGGHRWAHLLDLVAFGTPPGIFLGRLANFANGELIGRPCSPELPWAIKFPQEIFTWAPKQLAAVEPILAMVPPAAQTTELPVYGRLVDAVQNHNALVTTAIEPLLVPRHPSQLYAALLEGLVVFAILFAVWACPRTPGVIVGLFFVVYALARIVGDIFREPDYHIVHQEFSWFGVTRGQWLSVPVLLAGIVILVLTRMSTGKDMGGWRRSNGQVETTQPH